MNANERIHSFIWECIAVAHAVVSLQQKLFFSISALADRALVCDGCYSAAAQLHLFV